MAAQTKKKRHRLRNAWKSLSEQSRLSVPQLIATALAAITMAVVSSRLTSFSSSILIVGLISVVSALSSEFYRIVVTASAEKTKEVVAPVIGVATSRSTGNDTTVVALDETVVAPKTDGEGVAGADGEDRGGHADEDDHAGAGTHEKARPVASALLHNQVVQMSFVFLLVALITVGVSYMVARAQGGDEFNTYTTVEQTLSDEEKQALVDEAAQKAQAEASQQQDSQEDQTPEVTEPQPGEEQDQDLAAQVEALQRENAALQDALDSLSANLAAEQDQISDLLARLEALESRLATSADVPDEG